MTQQQQQQQQHSGGATTPLMMETIQTGFVPFLQLMSVDLQGRFNTGLLKSKCLNTAVLVMYLAAGEEGLKNAFTCTVNKIIPRYANLFDPAHLNDAHYRNLATTLDLSRVEKGASLADAYYSEMKMEFDEENPGDRMHYIMLTDCEMKPHGQPDSDSTAMFPGHVFVIEQRNNEFHLYQSYINAYDMRTQVTQLTSSGKTRRSKAWMKRFMTGLNHFIHSDVWDKKAADWWQFLTHTDANKFVGFDKSRIYLCHKSMSSPDAHKHFHKYVDKKLDELRGIVKRNPVEASKVHGDVSLFYNGLTTHKAEHRSYPNTIGHLIDFLHVTKKQLVARGVGIDDVKLEDEYFV